MYRWFYIFTTRLCLALIFSGVAPIFTSQAILVAQSKKKNPAQASKFAKRGNTRAKNKDFKGALSDYKKAFQLNPSASYKKKIQQLTSLAAKQGGGKKSKGKVSKKQVAQASKYAKRGSSKAKKKDYAGALKDFQRAQKLNPSNSNKKRISQLASIMKKSSGGQSSRRRTKAKMPKVSDIPTISPVKYANDIYNIAEAFEVSTRNLAKATNLLENKQKKKIESVRLQRTPTTYELENAARTEPNDFRKQVDLARNYEALGRFDDSKEIYLHLAAQNPLNADVHFHLGAYYARFDQMTKARHAFDEALDIQPNHRATIEAMATFFNQKEDRSFSDEMLAKSAEKDPAGPAQLISRIRKNLDEFNFEYAARLSQSGQDKFPKQEAFILFKGKAFEGLGDMEKAKSSYQESIKSNPTNHEPYVALGDLYSSQGKYLYAALTYSDAVRLDPANEDVRFLQGLGYFKSIKSELNKLYKNNKLKLIKCNHDNINKFMKQSDLTIVLSEWNEQYGRVIQESAACGSIVIGSKTGAIPEILIDDEFVFEPKNAFLLKKKIENIYYNFEFLRTKFDKVEQIINEKRSINNQAKLINEIFC